MIAFREGWEPDEFENYFQDLLGSVNEINIDKDYSDAQKFEDINLSELLEVIYNNLYLEENSYINISIKKSKNNSLNLKIEDLR